MRSIVALAGIAAIQLGLPDRAVAQAGERLNPVIALQEKGLPVFGISHPAIQRRAGRGGSAPGAPGAQGAAAAGTAGAAGAATTPAAPPAAPQPEIVLGDVAKQTVDY